MRQEAKRLLDWLRGEALPFWSTRGVDREYGGFVERVEPDGTMIADVRRARLVARQIYVFSQAREVGWNGPAEELVDHGLLALRRHHIGSDDVVVPRYQPTTNTSEGAFDLYDQAFALFGLAHGFAVTADQQLEQQALRILARMREGWQHPLSGFAEDRPAVAPLKANPHMHLLEASLAWIEVSGADEWHRLAAEVTELCLSRFIAPGTGALHEYFDVNWRLDLTPGQDVVEPGHQSEWAWLLMRCARHMSDQRIEPVARRLFEIAETSGLNREQARLINELDAALAPRWSWMRLWPQTERIKSLVLFARLSDSATERAVLEGRAGSATAALLGYFDHPLRGSWWEHMDQDGKPVAEPARASSLYHIMGAAVALAPSL